MSSLAGKVVVVTGGGRGIGAAISRRVLELGGKVVVTDLSEQEAGQTVAELNALAPDSASFVRCDVRDSADVTLAASSACDVHGRIDGLVNNAGIVISSPTLEHTDEVWADTIAVNLSGAFYCAREFGRVMGAGGSIVNISSIAGVKAVKPEMHVAYGTSKAGIAHMSRILAAEWAPRGIRVNAVGPGYTNTDILKAVGQTDPAIVADWISQIPLHRLIEPVEIANVVCFLLSDDSSAVTGHLLMADAGYSVW